jgi:hypothetical protein
VELRDKHAGLEKRVAEQSARLDKARRRSHTDPPARSGIKRRGGRSQGSDRT